MRYILLVLLSVAALHAQDLPPLDRFDPALMDKTKNPCDSFFKYACSTWMAAHPIPADLAANVMWTPLYLYNQTILRNALEKAAANPQASGTERIIGDFWRSCMDESGRNANGGTWLKTRLAVIDTLKSKKDLPRVLAYLHLNFPATWAGDDNSTKVPLFGFGPAQDLEDSTKVVASIDQGGMALPSLDYYVDEGAKFKVLRQQYLDHVQKMFQLAGEPAEQAAGHAKTVLEIETAFARASMDNVTRRDPVKIYNKRTLAQLRSAVPHFAWTDYFTRMSAPAVPFYIVTTPGFLDAMEKQIATRPVADWQTYLRWWTIHRAALYIGKNFEQTSFDYFGTRLSGTPQMLPQWRRCVGSADRFLGEALGQAYVNIAFPAESKTRANQIVADLRRTLQDEIRQLDWMSEQTKKQAAAKEDSTLQKIGYPDKWIDYSSVKTSPGDYLANMNAANAAEARRQIRKIGKPVDRKEWQMTPATIDAYEDSQTNTINFPAGILQFPLFGAGQDTATNLGGIGMVIGHEAIHGFDDQGRKFDEKGNLRDWWTAEDAKRYDEKDKCIVDQSSQEVPEYGIKQKGELTAGEDTADNGGLHLAFTTLDRIYKSQGKSIDTPEADGLTARQRFFMSFAFSWCGQERPEAERNDLVTNPHSLARFRVDRPLSNMPEFQQAFGCKEGQAMVHRPACRVW